MPSDKTDLRRTLFAEKSLGELLGVYESSFPRPLPAKALGFSAFCLCLTFSLIGLTSVNFDYNTLLKSSAMIAALLLTVSVSLMGVVIAGMAIFASSLRPRIATLLIETPYPGTSISSLKFVFAMFCHLLVQLFWSIVVSSAYYIVFAPDSLIFGLARKLLTGTHTPGDFWSLLCMFYLSVIVGFVFFVGSLLHSFIWNLHQVLLVIAALDIDQNDG